MGLFFVQWILNVSWNPAFFLFHQALLGLIIIVALTLLIAFITKQNTEQLGMKTLFILPYLLWLLIATSLNGYIVLNN